MILRSIRERRSIRAYDERPVEDDKLYRVLEAARLAPSAKNKQNWKMIIVKNKETRQKLVEACNNQAFVGEAPIVIVACSTEPNYKMRCGQYAYPIDIAIALDHLSLQAVAEGLGTCWIGSFYEDKVKELLNIPNEVRVVELMTLGYPNEAPPPRPRKPFSELFIEEKWE